MRSVRDQDNNSKQWLRNRRTTNNGSAISNAVAQVTAAINRSRRRIVTPPMSAELVYPFKIYQMGATNQFQLRGGYIGYRGNYLLPDTNIDGTRAYYNGNNELVLFGCGTDLQGATARAYEGYVYPPAWNLYSELTQNSGAPITIDGIAQADTPVLICSNQPSSSNPLGTSVVWENSNSSGGALWFWIVIKDSETDGPYTELWAGNSVFFETLTKDFGAFFTPEKATDLIYEVIPIGCVLAGEFQICQFQSENLLNRYVLQSHKATQLFNKTDVVSYNMPQRFRGKWSADLLDGSPSSILTFVGDIVIDDRYSKVISGVSNVNMAYIKLPDSSGHQIFNDISNAPSSSWASNGVNWSSFMLNTF